MLPYLLKQFIEDFHYFQESLKNPQENTYTGVSFVDKVTNWRPATLFIKETPEQMFSSEFYKVCKNTYFVVKLLLYRSSHCSHQKWSIKKLFLKVLQYLQKNTGVFL